MNALITFEMNDGRGVNKLSVAEYSNSSWEVAARKCATPPRCEIARLFRTSFDSNDKRWTKVWRFDICLDKFFTVEGITRDLDGWKCWPNTFQTTRESYKILSQSVTLQFNGSSKVQFLLLSRSPSVCSRTELQRPKSERDEVLVADTQAVII